MADAVGAIEISPAAREDARLQKCRLSSEVTTGSLSLRLRCRGLALLAQIEGRQVRDDRVYFEGDGNDLPDKAEDILWVVLAVGVVGDAGA